MRHRSSLGLILAGMMVWQTQPVFARGEGTGFEEETLFADIPTVISSTLKETKAALAPSTIFTVSGDEIRRWGIRRLSELVDRLIPGAAATEDSDDVIMAFRGVASDTNLKTILLVNGHYTTMQWNNGPQSEIELGFLNDIKAVEVITGPGSALYGSGATIGVFNIITESAKEDSSLGPKVMARGGSGSFKQFDTSAGGRSDENTNYYYSVGALTSKGLEVHNNLGANNKPLNVDRFPMNYRFYANVNHKGLELTSRWTSSSRAFHDLIVSPVRNLWTNYDAGFIEAKQTLQLGDETKLIANLSYDTAQVQRHDFITGNKFRGVGEDRYGGKVTLFHSGFSHQDLTLGAEYRRDQFGKDWDGANFSFSTTVVTGIDPFTRRTITPYFRNVVGVFGQDIVTLNSRLTWLLGGRYDYIQDLFPGAKESAVTPRSALVYQPAGGSVIKLMYSSGFHQAQGVYASPDAFAFGGTFAGVINKPETMSSFELSGSQRFGEKADAGLTFFHNTLKNPHGIVAVGTSAGAATSAGEIDFDGFEAVVSVKPVKQVFVRAIHQYVKLGSTVNDPLNAFTTADHKHVATAPEQLSKLLVEYRPTAKLSFNANANCAWKTYTLSRFVGGVVSIPGQVLGPQITVNANISVNLTDHTQIVLSGYNVTDVRSKVATSNTGTPDGLATKNRAPVNYMASIYHKF